MLKRGIADFVNGYALPKLLVGFGLWNLAVERFKGGSKSVVMLIGIVAIGATMESIRLIRKWCSRKK